MKTAKGILEHLTGYEGIMEHGLGCHYLDDIGCTCNFVSDKNTKEEIDQALQDLYSLIKEGMPKKPMIPNIKDPRHTTVSQSFEDGFDFGYLTAIEEVDKIMADIFRGDE